MNRTFGLIILLLILALLGCDPKTDPQDPAVPRVRFVNLSAPTDALIPCDSMALEAGRNEWTSFAIELPRPTDGKLQAIRLRRPRGQSTDTTLSLSMFSAFQIVPMPVDLNRAAFVRHTGLPTNPRRLPRALLPLAINNGRIDLSHLKPVDGPTLVWIDLRVPRDAGPGVYLLGADLISAGNESLIAPAPLKLTIYDFSIPDERHLQVVSRITWNDLVRLFPDQFTGIATRLMRRSEASYSPAIKTLDDLIGLAQSHRLNAVAIGLQPTVKWPAGSSPIVDWKDFDSILSPWLKGDAFADKIGLAYWPLPNPEFFSNFDIRARSDYWKLAAVHFDQYEWLNQTSVLIDPPRAGRVSTAEAILQSADAAGILNSHPRLKVTVPLEFDQLLLRDARMPTLIPPESAGRLQAVAAPLVSDLPIRNWPAEIPRPSAWLRTDLPGLMPHVGAGAGENDVRAWAFLSHLRLANLVMFPNPLPAGSASDPAGESEFIWFYPGSWFGLDQPVATIELKWLRRMEQDYEYLYLARQRGEAISAQFIARMIAKPIELTPTQPADPAYTLLSGTTSRLAWDDLQHLMAQTLLSREPGKPNNADKLKNAYLAQVRWRSAQEQALMLPRAVQWLWDPLGAGGNVLEVRVGVDLYNPTDDTQGENRLAITRYAPGWQVRPAQSVPQLIRGRVQRINLDARFDLDKLSVASRSNIELNFTDGFSKRSGSIPVSLPVSASVRREARLTIDGSLEDWEPDDALQNGPLVQMLSRPSVQGQELRPATTSTQVYSNWSDEQFYLGFKLLGGQQKQVKSMRNFVQYDQCRAWGEDLCEVLIQPVYVDSAPGPILHIICKPGGQWVERKLDPKRNADPWQPVEGAAVRYASTLDGSTWRGELAIPWKIIIDEKRGRPALLRFNFVQHKNQIGESASWAGPIDFGRDEQLMGLLHLREPVTPGMK